MKGGYRPALFVAVVDSYVCITILLFYIYIPCIVFKCFLQCWWPTILLLLSCTWLTAPILRVYYCALCWALYIIIIVIVIFQIGRIMGWGMNRQSSEDLRAMELLQMTLWWTHGIVHVTKPVPRMDAKVRRRFGWRRRWCRVTGASPVGGADHRAGWRCGLGRLEISGLLIKPKVT